MDRKERQKKLQTFKSDERRIRQILNDWDPIAGSPDDEYDYLVHRLMLTLHKGEETTESISSLISYELTHHFGFEESKNKIDAISEEIVGWWVPQKTSEL
ncbi:unnamed protein product [marine sediment metagenome]|uniref:DUF1871 domain-containing protein n=1 Tax=marine sediment metagenome TaxID=412755 RepID=X0V1E8_9ZZZZ